MLITPVVLNVSLDTELAAHLFEGGGVSGQAAGCHRSLLVDKLGTL